MAGYSNTAKSWLTKKNYLIFPLLALIIPILVRAIPEVIMGQYVAGFDTMAYYVTNSLDWLNNSVNPVTMFSSAPLIYLLLMGIASTGASIVFALKILAPVILGILSFSTYLYASRALSWSPKKSLFAALLATLYFVALRISWDMLRSEIALTFLFLALILLQKNQFTAKNSVAISVLMLLVAFTHQLIAIIMFVMVIATLLSQLLKKEKANLPRLIAISIPAALLFFAIFFLNYFSISATGYSMDFGGGFEALIGATGTELLVDILGFLAFCYLPLMPLLIFARKFKSNIQLKAWIVWTFFPLILILVSQNAFLTGGVPPFRWILLLTYPLAFYAIDGLTRIKWNWYKASVGAILVVLSLTLLVSPNSTAVSYYATYPSYIPKSMLQNTLPLDDCQDTTNALVWANNNMPNNGRLLAHEAFFGQAMLVLDQTKLVPYWFATPTDAIAQMEPLNQSSPVYLIWWVNGTGWYGQPTVSSVFQEVYRSGNIAIYNYSGI